MKRSAFWIIFFGFLLFAQATNAHEAYVLSKEQLEEGLRRVSFDSFAAFQSPQNIKVAVSVGLGVAIALGLSFLFRRSKSGRCFYRALDTGSLHRVAPLVLRLALAASLFFSAFSGSFFGPELPLNALPFSETIRIALFAISGFLALGLLTEVMAFIALLILGLGVFVYGLYTITYAHYLGEIIALFLFGSGLFSLDKVVSIRKEFVPSLKRYEETIIRIFYGIALSYAAVSVKLLHPLITETVINQYHLTRLYLLFPHDPLFATLGAGLAELAIGLFIIIGFELRFTVAVSLFYLILSLLFFREAVWPHLMLYGISFYLLFTPEVGSVSNLLMRSKVFSKES